jgi:tetratricopeptide (TPR) repeat protein
MMGLFSWLFGKRRNAEPRPPRPKVVAGLDENSPQVLLEMGNAVMVMDREQFDYVYGESQAPDPAQRDLEEVLPRVTRVRAIASGMFRGQAMGSEVILETTDAEALAAFRKTLKIDEDPRTFSHCACLGGPTLELCRDQELLATIGLQHGNAIRWKKWKHDARLRNGQALNDWLTRYGIEPALLDALLHNHYDAGGMMPLGLQRRGPLPLSRAEQRVRLVELARVRGGDLEAALAQCQKVLEAEPNLAFAYAVRALIHSQRGDHPRCVADCTRAIELGLREAEIFFARAVAQDYLGRPQEALADCDAALQIDPQHANAYNSRGLIRGRLGQLEEALGDFAQAIRLAPKWFLPYLHRAEVCQLRGQFDAALADYDRVIDLMKQSPPSPAGAAGGPTLALVYCRRGEARFDQFREGEAEADFAEARRLDPAVAAYLGDMWLRRNQFDRASDAFSDLIRVRPKDARGYAGRGMVREALGDLDRALDDYSTAIRCQPDGVGYALRAQVRQRQGQFDEALADLAEHLRLHPDDVMAYLSRSVLYKQRGALSEALQDLNTAHRAAPDNPMVCNNLAWMLATCTDDRLRDGGRAFALARQACQATEWKNPFCLDTLAAACAETGVYEEAVRWQTQSLDLCNLEEKPVRRVRLQRYQARQPYRE